MWNKLGLRFDAVPTLIDGETWWGLAWLGTVCGKRSANINSVTTDRSMGILIRHELLHILGLGEDDMKDDVIKEKYNGLIDNNKFPCLYQRASKDFKRVNTLDFFFFFFFFFL